MSSRPFLRITDHPRPRVASRGGDPADDRRLMLARDPRTFGAMVRQCAPLRPGARCLMPGASLPTIEPKPDRPRPAA